ncbi:protein kinase family protein [Streptomyces microflavus]|uniref:hypothetical protein n=1 Tax=Streptomyces microflavus TaxID=1919 RepID=UPI00380B7950
MADEKTALKFQITAQVGEVERDGALVAFLKARLSERAEVADEFEKRLLVGTHRTLLEFEEKFNHPQRHHERNAYFAGQMDALCWSLRCTAFAAFSGHPDFRHDFRPDALTLRLAAENRGAPSQGGARGGTRRELFPQFQDRLLCPGP